MIPEPSEKDHEVVEEIRRREKVSGKLGRIQACQNATQATRNIIDLLLLKSRGKLATGITHWMLYEGGRFGLLTNQNHALNGTYHANAVRL